jgi:hypothetical protein
MNNAGTHDAAVPIAQNTDRPNGRDRGVGIFGKVLYLGSPKNHGRFCAGGGSRSIKSGFQYFQLGAKPKFVRLL